MRWLAGGSTVTVRIVGESEDVIKTIEAAGYTAATETPTTVGHEESSAIVTVGEEALLATARERPDAPILAVGTDIGPAAGDRAAICTALADGVKREQPLVEVSVDGKAVSTALLDVMLVTSEPARISEYAIEDDDRRIAAFRADGVVVATPAGSRGYAATAGGPTIDARTGAFCAVPIAPFHTQSTRWVLDTNPLTLSVLRDEGSVSLLVDDTEYGSVGPDQRVRLAVDGAVRTLH